ncbi:MAG: hypothetical protein SGJ18_14855 [Pseudomonadota bacterium]|nr:hypothetical protein [Pseudomonadota bacterium]
MENERGTQCTIIISSLLLVHMALATDTNLDTINSVCKKLNKRCDAEVLLQNMSELEKISRRSVVEKIREKFIPARFLYTNIEGKQIWGHLIDEDRLMPIKRLMQGGADLGEALYLTTFFSIPPTEVGVTLRDQLRLFRFQFKTKRNKTDCLKIQLAEVKDNICRATKNCSVPCEDIDQPVIQQSQVPHAPSTTPSSAH